MKTRPSRLRGFRRLTAFALLLAASFGGCTRTPFRVAWLSDTHVGAEGAAENLRDMVADINSLPEVKLVLVTGDITETGSLDELRLAKDILDGLRAPLRILPGNHDTKWSGSGATDFVRLWGSDRFDSVCGGVRLVGMHQGPIMRMGDGHFSPQDVRWFERRTSGRKAGTRPLVFVTHYPLDESIANWFVVLDRLKTLPTRAVLVGHGHRNRILDFEGLAGVMGRSALGAKDSPGGYNVIEITSGELTFSERLTGRATAPAWYSVGLRESAREIRTGEAQAIRARPDFSVNRDYPAVRDRWAHEAGWTIAAAPTAEGPRVFFGDASGTMTALHLADGAVDWGYRTGGPIYSTPASDGTRIIFGSADGHVYALDAKTGRLNWKTGTARPVVASPVVANGKVFIGSSDGVFRALDSTTGKILWRHGGIGGFVEAKPLLAEGRAIFGAWDGNLYALNAKNGNLAWTWRGDRPLLLYSPAACWPVRAEGLVFIVAPDRRMTAIEIATGRQVWRSDRWAVRESIGISADGSRLYVRTTDGIIAAFPTSSSAVPEPLWELEAGIGSDINSAMLIEKDGVVFYGTKNGLLLAIDGVSGTLLWKHRVGVALLNTVFPISGREVLVTDFDGRVTRVVSDF